MKTCPICGAVTFDDQTTCYGCLHDYNKDEPPAETQQESPCGQVLPGAASFLLSLVPQPQPSGSFAWSCTVQPVE